MMMMKKLGFLLAALLSLAVGAADPASLYEAAWEKLLGQQGCLMSASAVGFTTEGSVFSRPGWRELFRAAKTDEKLFDFIVGRIEGVCPTRLHICNFHNASEGEAAVFAAQQIIGRNWYDYDGDDAELTRIAGREVAAKVQLLRPVLENAETRAALRTWFLEAYRKMRSPDAPLNRCRAAAERGDAAAQFELGMRYVFGLGLPSDRGEGERWLRKAADQGHETARCWCMVFGFGVERDPKSAAKLCRAAAEQGDPWAQLAQGFDSEASDMKAAMKWYRRSADQGNAVAAYKLAERYRFGGGGVVEKDPAASEKWMKLAAERGYEPAQVTLARLAPNRSRCRIASARQEQFWKLAAKHLAAVCGEEVPNRQQRRFGTSAVEDFVTVELRTESGGKGEVTFRQSDAEILKCVYDKSGGEPEKKLGPNPAEPVPEIAEKLRAGLKRANPAWECTEESFSLFRTELGLNLRISGAGLADLSALEDFDFDTVWLTGTAVRGTGFLKNAKSLRAFAVVNDKSGFREVDLSGLRGKPLRNLGLAHVRVADPACLAEIEFQILNLDHVENVDPAKFSRLRELGSFSAKDMTIGDVGFLRNSPKLRFVCLENVRGTGR